MFQYFPERLVSTSHAPVFVQGLQVHPGGSMGKNIRNYRCLICGMLEKMQ